MLFAAFRKGEDTTDESDASIVERVQQGDRQAFRILVERYQTRAFHVAKRVLRSEHDAEEVVQEAFVKAFLSLESFKGQSKFYTWFYRIVFNMAVDVQRKQQRRGRDSVEYIEDLGMFDVQEGEHEGPESNVANRELLELAQRALRKLSPEHRAVLVMREFDGLSYDEIAEFLNVNKGTVMSRLFYARKNLQKELSELEDGSGGTGPISTSVALNATKA